MLNTYFTCKFQVIYLSRFDSYEVHSMLFKIKWERSLKKNTARTSLWAYLVFSQAPIGGSEHLAHPALKTWSQHVGRGFAASRRYVPNDCNLFEIEC